MLVIGMLGRSCVMSAYRVHPDDELDIPVHDQNKKAPWYAPFHELVEVVWGLFLLYLVYFVTKYLLAAGF